MSSEPTICAYIVVNGDTSSRKGWTNCAQKGDAARIEAQLLVLEEIYRAEMRDLSRLSRKLLRDHNPCASPDKRRADGSSGFPECEEG
ncbi:hypothetical protein T10_6968 [Trichinella papuae]|uniref:Uncharacterized protein n=1 Tax=Trichinella papuae TaxID=268474 RepID=A0A0V1N7K8_9BILA|nr:hypothetical protein T10_6968 [Trichinella papuae]